jgi:hypothetical protein
MLQGLRLVWIMLHALIFKDKNESNPWHESFNPKKFIVMIAMICSISLNIFLFIRFYTVGNEQIAIFKAVEVQCPKAVDELKKEFGKKP